MANIIIKKITSSAKRTKKLINKKTIQKSIKERKTKISIIKNNKKNQSNNKSNKFHKQKLCLKIKKTGRIC